MLKFVSEWLLWLKTGEYILREGGGNGCVAETKDIEITQENISAHLTRDNNVLNLGRGRENEKNQVTRKSYQDFVTDWIWGSEKEKNQN